MTSYQDRSIAATRTSMALRALCALLAGALAAACGGDDRSTAAQAPLPGATGPIAMAVVNQVPIPQPCFGPSLTFFEGTTPVDVPAGPPTTVQVSELFGAYQIGFQVNGWYWRTCTGPDDCPNPNACQNPDNAGQVAVEIASDCSTAKLVPNTFTCDALVPSASNAVTVTLQSSNPCTVVVAGVAGALTPTDDCCSCSSCAGSQIPAGQATHCQ